ncbi:peroxiredoxin family protein [Mucilaginibacter kameinonensis]|uniref:peroxiredoxin family protein n=1 Tax=Mucilaginibacter kameinonensis TaxID=452286 RepID=UPI0013CF0ED1|nr:TlpA disulfide reductase family protein [Mucilaginibacter kameinonensis]
MRSIRTTTGILAISAMSGLIACKSRVLTEKATDATNTGTNQATRNITYVLPDGAKISADKLDSVKQAWGADKMISKHDETDDANGIIHLVQFTDKMKEEMIAASTTQMETLQAMTGHQAASFSGTDPKGHTVQLSDLKGKVVVVNFWFTTCPPCLTEMGSLNELVKKYKGKAVVFLGITFNDGPAVTKFLKSHPFNFQQLVKANDVIKTYAIHNYPTSLVIDKNGMLKQFFQSGQDIGEQISKTIDVALS